MTTIFALATGQPPAAIAIMRISGPAAIAAASALAGTLPPARTAGLRALHDPGDGELLDRAMIIVFPAPASATGEDIVEMHLHGGRAVVDAVDRTLAQQPDLRRATAGEFTRRALANGRIDLAEAEGLGDLLAAETDLQRRAALAMSDGELSRQIARWRSTLLALAVRVEAAIDFADEIDVPEVLLDEIRTQARAVRDDMDGMLQRPMVERLHDGVRVVIAGPPNSGKSTLLNAMTQRDAAIVSDIPGTTRDRIDVPITRDGMPFVFTDTAGLRDTTDDAIERIGIERAAAAIAAADIVLWLGDTSPPRDDALWLHSRCDLPGRQQLPPLKHIATSIEQPNSIRAVWEALVDKAKGLVPHDRFAFNRRQADHCMAACVALQDVGSEDEIVIADALRQANVALARITGDVALEDMLDALFAKFCVGK